MYCFALLYYSFKHLYKQFCIYTCSLLYIWYSIIGVFLLFIRACVDASPLNCFFKGIVLELEDFIFNKFFCFFIFLSSSFYFVVFVLFQFLFSLYSKMTQLYLYVYTFLYLFRQLSQDIRV